MPRLHILGASGSGTTTLGAALAARLGLPQIDGDSLFWLPTEPPFTTRRAPEERLALLRERLPPTGSWIFSGSAIKWAMELEPSYDLVIYLTLDPAERMARLRRREVERYGNRLAPGGDMAEASRSFLAWAEAYDTAGLEQRSRIAHEAWLARQTAPVLRLDSARPVAALLQEVIEILAEETSG